MSEEQKNVVLTQEQYDALLGRMNRLEKASLPGSPNEDDGELVKAPTQHFGKVMFFEDKPVVKFKDMQTLERKNDDGTTYYVASDDIAFLVRKGVKKVKGENGEEVEKEELVEKTANYKGLLEHATRHDVEILDRKIVPVTRIQGTMPTFIWTSPTDPRSYRLENKAWQAQRVKLTQTEQKITVTVKFINGPLQGQTMSLDAGALNQ